MKFKIELDNPDGTANWDIAKAAFQLHQLTGHKTIFVSCVWNDKYDKQVQIFDSVEETIYMLAIAEKEGKF